MASYSTIDNLEETILHLHFTSNALAYAVFDPQKNFYTYFSTHKNLETQVDWDGAFSNDPYLRSHYRHTKAAFTNNLFSLIPHKLYDPREYINYLSFNVIDPEELYQSSHSISGLDAEVVFGVERSWKIILTKYFPQCAIFHNSAPLVSGILKNAQTVDPDRIYIYTWNSHDMEIVALKKGKLVLYNHFYLNTPEEFLYYPLYVCERLGFVRDQTEIYLGGNQVPNSKESDLLTPYFHKFSFLGLPPGYHYSPVFAFHGGTGLIQSLAYLDLCE